MATTNVDIRVSTTGANSLTKLDKALQRSTASTRRLDGALDALKGTLGAVGIALGTGAIFDKLAKSDKAKAAIRTLGVDASKLTTELKGLRKELNNNVSQLELQQNAFNVIQSGFKGTAEVTQILEAATKSAQAKLIDSTVVVNALTSTLNAYQLGAGSATSVTEKFFQTIADGSLTLDQYAAGIGTIAPTASAAGISLNELNAALSAATRIQASNDAFTGLGSVIDAIVAPTKQAKDLAAELGIEFSQQALEAKGLTGVLQDVFDATGGNVEQMTTLIGRMEGVNTLLALGNDGFTAYNKNLENQGSAAGKVDKAYDEMSNTITGALKRIQQSFNGLITSNGDFAQAIIPVFDSLTAIISALDTPMGAFILKIGLVTAGFYAMQKAILAVKATALAGFIQTQVALMTTFGVKIYAASAAQVVMTKTTIALRAALLTLPWVAAAAAIGYVAVKTIEARNAQAEFNRVLKEAPLDEVNSKIEELKAKLDKVKASSVGAAGGMSLFGGQAGVASLQVAQLNAQLAQLEQRQKILSKTYTIAGIQYDANMVPINPPKTVSEERAAAALASPLPTGSGSAGGGSAAPTGADGDEIIRRFGEELKLLQAKDDLEKTLLQNQFKYESSLRESGEILDASKRSTAEQLANEVLLAENRKAYTEYANEGFKQAMAEAKAREDALRPLEEQRELLEAKLRGNEKEVRLRQQVNQIMRDTPGLERSQVEELVKGNAALEEQIALYSQIAGAIASEMTGAFKSIIDGTKSVEEAFADMAQGIANKLLDMAMKILQDALFQQLMGLLQGLGSAGAGGFGGAPQLSGIPFSAGGIGYEGGGYTGDGPRSGGLDGKGGFLSVLHPQETVTDHYGDSAAAMTTAADNSAAFTDAGSAMEMATAMQMSTAAAKQEALQMAQMESSATTTVQVETTLVDQIEVVTMDQVFKATRESAKAAEANVYKSLKNRQAVRSRAGVK